jgi:hypothetical protein
MATSTQIYTYTTQPGVTQLFRRALPDEWLEIILRLETAGPVAIGHLEELAPVQSGRGRLLPSNEDIIVKLSPSSTLYILSAGIDRVSIEINAIPGLEDLLKAIGASSGHANQGSSEKVNIGGFGFEMPKKRTR